MSKHKYTTVVCIGIIAIMLASTILFMMGESLGIAAAHTEPPYASKLFSTDEVHTLDIEIKEDDWEEMLENAMEKNYMNCNVKIDGEAVKNVGIRTKGNSSLSSIAMSDSDRYSFKLEFDHYIGTQSYQGLDKLVLNSIAQDNTYLKDYLSYQMMNDFGADAPLSSFIYITVNGEEWGLYLAVEGVEESFAARNYGSNYSQLYKPDNMDMNAGRGNGGGEMPQPPQNGEIPEPPQDGEMPQLRQEDEASGFQKKWEAESDASKGNEERSRSRPGGFGGGMQGGFGGRDNSDIALIYTDDDYESYQNIFDNSKFNPKDTDKDRLIASIKQLNEGVNLEEVVNIDEVLRYFVVHNFVLNFDSYTGNMLHNYYLYEEDGILSMIAWDYNLAFGSFSMGRGAGSMDSSSESDSATSAVNYPIDTPVSGVDMEDRPLLNQLLSDEEYLKVYHSLFADFISEYFEGGKFEGLYDKAVALISPYVEKDPTAFCTYDEFIKAQKVLKEFCLLRAESIRGQLEGTIGSTSEAQTSTKNRGFVDASHIDINAMGSNMMGFRRARREGTGQINNSTMNPYNMMEKADNVSDEATSS